MAPSDANFWRGVLQSAASWGLVCAVGGIGWLSWQVPRQLDQLLAGQRAIVERATAIERRVSDAENDIQGLGIRVTRIESK
jgi:hypothetical protein